MSNSFAKRVTRVVLASNASGDIGNSGTPTTFYNIVNSDGFATGDTEYCYVKLEAVSPIIVSADQLYTATPIEISVDLPQVGSCDARTGQLCRSFGFMKPIQEYVTSVSAGFEYDFPLQGVKVHRNVFQGGKWSVKITDVLTGIDVARHYNAAAPQLLSPAVLIFTVSSDPL